MGAAAKAEEKSPKSFSSFLGLKSAKPSPVFSRGGETEVGGAMEPNRLVGGATVGEEEPPNKSSRRSVVGLVGWAMVG